MVVAGRGATGITLIELLVASSLSLLLLFVLWSVLRGVYRAAGQSLTMSQLQQGVAVAVASLEADLLDAHPAGVGRSDDGSALSVHRLGGITAKGGLVWSDLISVHRRNGAGELWQYLLAPGKPGLPSVIFSGLPLRLDSASLLALPTQGYLSARRLLEGVTVFRVDNLPGLPPPSLASRLQLTIAAERTQTDGRPPLRAGVTRQFCFRNRGN